MRSSGQTTSVSTSQQILGDRKRSHLGLPATHVACSSLEMEEMVESQPTAPVTIVPEPPIQKAISLILC